MAVRQIYTSRYRHGVDGKRRVQIPAKWRPDEENAQLTLLVWTDEVSQKICLRVIPEWQMEAFLARIEVMSTSDPEAVALRRVIAGDAEQGTMDKAGRICIPEKMAAQVGITDEAEMIGALQWFEIWSPEHFAPADTNDKALVPGAKKKI